MFKPNYGKCKQCGKDRLIVVKAGYCDRCNDQRKNKAKVNKQAVVEVLRERMNKRPRYRRKATGELVLFREIWSERRHFCSTCHNPLGSALRVHFFSHILSKGAYPSLRLMKQNIELQCLPCHQEWEVGDKSQPKFQKLRELAESLKQEYYKRRNSWQEQ